MKLIINDMRKGRIIANLKDCSTVAELIASLGENRETLIVSINSAIATSEKKISKSDKITTIPVVSGG